MKTPATPNEPMSEGSKAERAGRVSDVLSSLGFGLGTLAFVLWPVLIPGVNLEMAVVDSCAIALVGYIGLCLWGVYRCLHKPARHRPASSRPPR